MFSIVKISDVKSDIGAWVKLLRGQHKLSQQELADQLNLSRITIQNIENGKNFTIDTFLLIVQHFNQLEDFNAFLKSKKQELDLNIKSIY